MRVGREFNTALASVGTIGALEPTSSASIYTATFSCAFSSVGALSEYFALYSASADLIALFQSALDIPVNLVMIPSDKILKDPHNL